MVRVKQVFGVLILAMAVYYGYLAYRLVRDRVGRRGGILQRGGDAERAAGTRRSPRAWRPPSAMEAGAARPLGHVVQELPDDG